MKLDRNEHSDGRGKYALILLRRLELCERNATFGPRYTERVQAALDTLREAGALDEGIAGTDSEFFLLRLKDRSAAAALTAYAADASTYDPEWAREVELLAVRAQSHPAKKTPD